MSTARVSVNIDKEVKQNAQKILGDIGMDLTTAIDLFLRTVAREERIPFALQTNEAYRGEVYRRYVEAELGKAKIEASNPTTKRKSHGEVVGLLKSQKEARGENV